MDSKYSKYWIFELSRALSQRYRERPIQPDVFSDYETVQAWSYLNQAFPIVEMALKLLTEQVNHRSHDISDLFHRFSELLPDEAKCVEKATQEYIAFYTVDLRAHPEFASAMAFLEHIGDGHEYVKWRYWPLEGGHLKLMWPALFVEIADSLGYVLLDKRPYSVLRRVYFRISQAIDNPTRWVHTLEHFKIDGSDLISELNAWAQRHGGLLQAFERYLQRGIDHRYSEGLEHVLHGAHHELCSVNDSDIKYFVTTLTAKAQAGFPSLARVGDCNLGMCPA